MRRMFARTMLDLAKKDRKIVFLTGDLGYGFFENLQVALKDRFINAGVAEQNMVTLAGGLAYTGLKPWIFSIAPFVTIKVLEQLRNDICLRKMNVKIVGQGGGYDYELAGPTHHALEDIGSMLTLPNMTIQIPAAETDVEAVVNDIYAQAAPGYIRLTRVRKISFPLPSYKYIRPVRSGNKITLVALGSIIDKGMEAAIKLDKKIDLWVISKLPITLSNGLIKSLMKTRALCVVEEHCAAGGLGQHLSTQILAAGIRLNHFIHLYATGYPTKKTGSREFYLQQTGLDTISIVNTLKKYV